MLSRQELVRDMRTQMNGSSYMCAEDVCKYLGLGRDTVREFLRGLDYFSLGRKKLYHVLDIATVIENHKQVS